MKETIIMFNNIICFILNFLIDRANLANKLKNGFKLVPSAKAVDEQLGALIIHADGITNNEDNLNKAEERIEKLKETHNSNTKYTLKKLNEAKLSFANMIQQLDQRIERLEELESINIRRHYTDYTKELNK